MNINILHLLWIIPLSASFGFFLCSIFTISSQAAREEEAERREYFGK